MHDVIIVGSGVAGVGAALGLVKRGIKPLVIDVGFGPADDAPRTEENLYDFKARHDSFDLTIGAGLRGLHNHLSSRRVPVKLTAPNMDYVTRDADRLAPIDERQFTAVQSFATGGLGNVWGAGLYRLLDRDIEDFPICEADLERYFDSLTDEIGISGADDDLTPFFGSTRNLQPPIELSRNVAKLYETYQRKRSGRPHAFHLGRPRTGILSRDKDGRPPIRYDNAEFWQETRAIYTPRYTLETLVADGRVEYRRGFLVERWRESDNGVEVEARDLDAGRTVRFAARKLLMAAGAINTSKIALRSFDDYETELRLLENPAIQIPFVLPVFLGRELDTRAFGLVGLNLIWESDAYNALCQGSIMDITSPMRAEFFASLPYSARANLGLIRHLLPAMIVMQFYLPGLGQAPARVSLQPDGRLKIIGHANTVDVAAARPMLAFFRRLGAWTHPSLIVRVPTGHAVHYAGTLPMRERPTRYECGRFGDLSETDHVYIADSAAFTSLPAKNMSFGMMANAMRVAEHAADALERSAR